MSRQDLHLSPPLAANSVLQPREFVATNAAGDALAFTGASGQTYLGGVSVVRTDNTGGVAGDAFASVVVGTEHVKVAAGIQPKPGQHAYVETSTSATNVVPAIDPDAKFVGVFVQLREHATDEWLLDTRPAYYRRRPAVA